jgi:hypothetical protein
MMPIARKWLLNWHAPLVLGMGMATAWVTQQGWATVLAIAGYLLVLVVDPPGAGRRLSRGEALGVAAGVLAVVAAAMLTSFARPMPFPLNFAISVGLGTAMQFGMLNLLGGDGPALDLLEVQNRKEYRALLSEMWAMAKRMETASQQAYLPRPTAGELQAIAAVAGSIASRFEQRAPDLASASATLTILQQFDKVMAYYFKMRSGEQFVEASARRKEMTETEDRTIPMIRTALTNLGKQLDAGEVRDKSVIEGTLESLLRSLHLLDDVTGDADADSSAVAVVERQQSVVRRASERGVV